jgi:methionyl-tRNA formyltransferase
MMALSQAITEDDLAESADDRLVLFGDDNLPASRLLIQYVCKAATTVPGIHLAAICNTGVPRQSLLFGPEVKRWFGRMLIRTFNHEIRREPFLRIPYLRKISHRYGISYLEAPGGNIHDPGFLDMVRETKAVLGLACYNLKIFKPELLQLFHGVVNYHNGLLPFYKGLRATAWSVYKGEVRSGFAFHWMNEGIDTGPILLQDAIDILPGSTIFQLEVEKIRRAAQRIPELLDMMHARHPGIIQEETGNYYSKRDWTRIISINDSMELTSAELFRRLRAFGVLRISIHGRTFEVTRLKEHGDKNTDTSPFTLTTKDGKSLTPTRFKNLPLWLYKLYKNV